MLADSAEGARREVPQLMQVGRLAWRTVDLFVLRNEDEGLDEDDSER